MLKTPSDFLPLMAAPEAAEPLTFLFHGNQLLLKESTLALPDAAAGLVIAPERLQAVGSWNRRYYQAAWAETDLVPHPGYAWHGMRSLFGTLDDDFLGLAGRAYQLAEWARTHRYCGVCATPTVSRPGERCAACPACGMSAYPRISLP